MSSEIQNNLNKVSNSDAEMTFDMIYDKKNNAFDIIRFILSAMVIYAHSYALLLKKNPGDIIFRITKKQLGAGTLAVYCFFIVSGFLITQSIVQSRSYNNYLMKRVLRIFPAFFVSLCLSAFLVGPIFSKMSFHQYFNNFFTFNGNTPLNYILKNITFNVRGYSWGIYDVFSTNPYPSSINGSMWTLKHEFAAYLFLIILSYFGILKHRKLYIVYTVVLGLAVIANYKFNYKLFNISSIKFLAWGEYEYSSIVTLAFYFTIGSLFYIYKDKIYYNKRFILLSILVILISNFIFINSLKYILLIFLPYLILSIAIGFRFSEFNKYGDFSYGLYIYGFTIQQIIAYYFSNKLNVAEFFLLSFFITLALAFLSWRYIEKPAAHLKTKFQKHIVFSQS